MNVLKLYNEAKKIKAEEMVKKFPIVCIVGNYVDNIFIKCDTSEELLKELKEAEESFEVKLYVFGSKELRLKLDADMIIENACEYLELHEEAYEEIRDGGKIKELQEILDKWTENVEEGTTYETDYSYALDLSELNEKA